MGTQSVSNSSLICASTFRTRSGERYLSTCLPGILLLIFTASPSLADERNNTDRFAPNPAERVAADRRVLLQLEELDQLIESADGPGFSRSLEQLRLADPRGLVPADGSFQPLHRVLAKKLLRADSSLQTIADADNKLAEIELRRILPTNSPAELLTVLHRFSGTVTAQRIHLLLARIAADRGQIHAARWWLRPLTLDTSTGVLADSARRFEQQLITSLQPADAKETVPAPSDSGPQDQQIPQVLSWINELSYSWILSSHRERIRAAEKTPDGLSFIAREPLIDSSRIFVQQPHNITAWDRRTGKPIWAKSVDRNLSPDPSESPTPRVQPNAEGFVATFERNELDGSMSADEQRLYVLSNSSADTGAQPRENAMNLRQILGRITNSVPQWELSALDKMTGKRLWTTGGAPVEEQFGNELAGHWFCGPPLAVANRLFAVVETPDHALAVACLQSATGQLLYTTPLLYPEDPIDRDVRRQFLRAFLQESHGLLLASTTTDWVTAMDLVTGSVIWARPLPLHQQDARAVSEPIRRFGPRRTSTILTSQDIPRSEAPFVTQDHVLWQLAQTPEPILTSLFTGELSGRIRGKPLLSLWRDPDICVTASQVAITAWELPGCRQLWKFPISHPGPIPVGRAALINGQLIIPRSDGSALPISLRTGTAGDPIQGIRSAGSAGGFYGDQLGMISFGLDHLSVLVARDEDRAERQASIARTKFLLEKGEARAAKTMLDSLPDRTHGRILRRQLSFRIALQLLLESEEWDESLLLPLQQNAEQPAERAVATMLQLSRPPAGDPRAYAALLFEALQLPVVVLQVQLPEAEFLPQWMSGSIYEELLEIPKGATGRMSSRRPLREFILVRLSQLLDQHVGEADLPDWLQQIEQLKTQDLLHLTSLAAVPEQLRRLEQHPQGTIPDEQTMHLMFAAEANLRRHQSASPDQQDLRAPTAFQERLLAFRDRIATTLNDLPQPTDDLTEIQRRLLQTAIPDSGGLSAIAIGQPLDPADWTMIPVMTANQVYARMSGTASPRLACSTDPFLAPFDWTVRRDTSRFQAVPVAAGHPGSISVAFKEAGALSTGAGDTLLRSGTVILHFSPTSVSAYSILDRKLLWNKAIAGTSGGRPDEASVFTDYDSNAGSQMLLQDDIRRLCGVTTRWICLLDLNRLVVLDILTGKTLWTTRIGEARTVFAAESCILVPGAARGEHQLDPISGFALPKTMTRISSENGGELLLPLNIRLQTILSRTLQTAQDQLVVWDPEFTLDDRRCVQWIEPRTLRVMKEVELPDHVTSQVLDTSTLVSFTADQQAHLLDLQTSDLKTFSYANPDPDAKTFLADQLAAAVDLQNLYVFDQPAAQNRPTSLIGLRCERVSSELRAINRSTGELAWVHPLTEPAYASFDQPAGQVLLLITIADSDIVNQPAGMVLPRGNRLVIHGLDRTTGKVLFEHPIVGQFLLRSLKMTRLEDGQLELEAFGNRARLFRRERVDGAIPDLAP